MAIRIIRNRKGDALRCKPSASATFNTADRQALLAKGWDISPITDKFLSETAFPPQGEAGEVDELD